MHKRAGQLAQLNDLVDIDALLAAYYDVIPDVNNPDQKVVFGTSGHRGTSTKRDVQRSPHRLHHRGDC